MFLAHWRVYNVLNTTESAAVNNGNRFYYAKYIATWDWSHYLLRETSPLTLTNVMIEVL